MVESFSAASLSDPTFVDFKPVIKQLPTNNDKDIMMKDNKEEGNNKNEDSMKSEHKLPSLSSLPFSSFQYPSDNQIKFSYPSFTSPFSSLSSTSTIASNAPLPTSTTTTTTTMPSNNTSPNSSSMVNNASNPGSIAKPIPTMSTPNYNFPSSVHHRFAPLYSTSYPAPAPTWGQYFPAPSFYMPSFQPMSFNQPQSIKPMEGLKSFSKNENSPSKSSISSTSSSSTNNASSGISSSSIPKPPHPNSKRKKKLSKEEILKYINYPQPDAAKMLNVSVSTLKRRFYELGLGRWPYPTSHLSSKSSSSSLDDPSDCAPPSKIARLSPDNEQSFSQPQADESSNISINDENSQSMDSKQQETGEEEKPPVFRLSSSASPKETLVNKDPISFNNHPFFIHSKVISGTTKSDETEHPTTDNIMNVVKPEKSKSLIGEIVRRREQRFEDASNPGSATTTTSSIGSTEEDKIPSPPSPTATPRTKMSIRFLSNEGTAVSTPDAKFVDRRALEAMKNSF